MRKFLFLIFLFPSLLYSQLESYDLTSYKTNDYNFKSLLFFPNFGFNYDSSQNGGDGNYNFNTDADLNFNKIHFSRARQSNLNAALFIDADQRKGITDRYLFDGRIQLDAQKYYREKRSWGYGYFARIQYENDVTNSLEYDASISVSHVWGRVENVTDAWYALQILKDQNKFGHNLNTVPHEVISQMGDTITSLRNERYFDSRHNQINQLDQLLGYVRAADIGFNESPIAYVQLFDSWRFERFTSRLHGSEFEIEINPSYNRENIYSDLPFDQNRAYYLLSSELSYIDYKVINQDWQFNRYISAGAHLYNELLNMFNDKNLLPYMELGASIAYYQSVRTFYTAILEFNYDANFDLNNDWENQNSTLNSILTFRSNHYFSPRMQLRANINFNHRNNLNESNLGFTDQLRLSGGIGITYNFF